MNSFLAALFGSIVGPLITRFLDTFFGNFRRVEAERDALCSQICENIDILLDDCKLFWGQDAESIAEQRVTLLASIQARLHHINSLQNELFSNEPARLKLTKEEWREVHRSATGGRADDEDRPAEGGRLRAILQDGFQLRQGIKLRRSKMKRGMLSG